MKLKKVVWLSFLKQELQSAQLKEVPFSGNIFFHKKLNFDFG